jgi:rhodanese-related sulfurtransferase/membrane protein insertase Oxa1/YidC/SpoIIIJ/phosphohistidine swiveling domain-containing protein
MKLLRCTDAAKMARALTITAAAFVAASLLASTPSYALPSPDLVVGSISSISQLIALVSAMVGGGAVVVGVRASANASGAARAARIAWRVAAVAGLFLVLSLAANYYQYSTSAADRQTRLEAAIQRPTEMTDGKTLDPDLKEVSYDEQVRSPLGISTEEIARLIEEKGQGLAGDKVFLDVRENAETETGMLPYATAIRFPDLSPARISLSGKRTVFLCDNGNRSYETCSKLAALGIDCRFMVGGLEKWFAEHRPMGDKRVTSLADFRSLADYPNKDTLLDTPDVRKLIDEGAVFVDVRYPGEFSTYHLPQAIDLPIRPTPLDKLQARIAALPHRPIIAPCYDRRSCFYAQILGHEVSAAGYDFRGRYTVPGEYFIAPPPRPYIREYLAELHRSWWGKLVDLLAATLNRCADWAGFLPVILLLALVSRLTVLPFSLKAERDQIVSRRLDAEVRELKRRLASDGRRMARAMRGFYRRHGLTPLRNLVGLLFLPVISVCVAAVNAVAVERHQGLLWATDAAARDRTLVLPLVFAALICLYLDIAFARTQRQRALIWLIGMIALTATGAVLSIAVDVYLVASACLLLVQRITVSIRLRDVVVWLQRLRLSDGVVSLDDVSRLHNCGNKARHLGVMRSQGFAVPEGVALTTKFLERFAEAPREWRTRELNRIWRYMGAKKLAVRSSGSAEDGSANSFAGVFESILNVDRARLESAIDEVLASFRSARVAAYGSSSGQPNIVVQRMVDPVYAGVLFTRDLGSPTTSLVEFVPGAADKLVSGTVTPILRRFGRASLQPIGGDASPMDLKSLVVVGLQLESLFGGPQDVEWAYAEGCFYLVQSRDITRLEGGNAIVQGEWARVLDSAAGAVPNDVVFEQNELSEVLPRPSVLSLSLMEGLWASGGSIDLACRRLGLGYRVDEDARPYLQTVFGRLYVDKREEIARAPQINVLAMRRLKRLADRIKDDFKDDFLPGFLREISLQEVVDFERLSTADLLNAVGRIRDNYVSSTSVAASVINIAADFYLRQAKERLIAAKLEPASFLAHAEQTEFERAVAQAGQCPPEIRREMLLQAIGHRAGVEYELAQPRYAEQPADLDPLLGLGALPVHGFAEIRADLEQATDDPKLKEVVLTACTFQTLKEDAKHHSLREIAVLRRVLLAVDRRFKLDGLVFHFTFEEIDSLCNEIMAAKLRVIAAERRQRAAELAQVSLPESTLTPRQIEEAALGIHSEAQGEPGRLAGIRVSGSGVVEGRACVVMQDDAAVLTTIPDFQDGDIVVSRMVPPAWIPYFQRAGGFVCEVGGWLSHTAIIAREFNVPLIVQAKVLHVIKSGEVIRLLPDGGIEVLAKQPLLPAASA